MLRPEPRGRALSVRMVRNWIRIAQKVELTRCLPVGAGSSPGDTLVIHSAVLLYTFNFTPNTVKLYHLETKILRRVT